MKVTAGSLLTRHVRALRGALTDGTPLAADCDFLLADERDTSVAAPEGDVVGRVVTEINLRAGMADPPAAAPTKPALDFSYVVNRAVEMQAQGRAAGLADSVIASMVLADQLAITLDAPIGNLAQTLNQFPGGR